VGTPLFLDFLLISDLIFFCDHDFHAPCPTLLWDEEDDDGCSEPLFVVVVVVVDELVVIYALVSSFFLSRL